MQLRDPSERSFLDFNYLPVITNLYRNFLLTFIKCTRHSKK